MPKLGKAGSLQSRQAIVHSLGHTESWATDLSWLKTKAGTSACTQLDLKNLVLIGELPAHDGLWDSAIATSKDLLARLAIEHCVHEARGVDVLPTTISRFRNGGDNVTADILERVVCPEEITHCATGVKWFTYLCLRSRNPALYQDSLVSQESQAEGDETPVEEESEEMIQKFHGIVRTHFRGSLKPPFNEKARKAAGFVPQWYEPLAVKQF